MVNWRDSVSQNVGPESIEDINKYVSRCDLNNTSPIDEFYSESQSILALFPMGIWTSNTNSWVGALSSIAVVSSVENYFRQVFSKILKICVIAQKTSTDNQIALGSVIWHPQKEIERGAFENLSLASSEMIKKTSKKFLKIDLEKHGLETILEEFDKVCELRHSIVHSGKQVAGKNGINLNLKSSEHITKVEIGFDEFQEILAVCNTLVIATNKILFEELVIRWATSWRNVPSWNPSDSNKKFKEIWYTFYSQRDYDNSTIPVQLTWIKCRNKIKQEFNINSD